MSPHRTETTHPHAINVAKIPNDFRQAVAAAAVRTKALGASRLIYTPYATHAQSTFLSFLTLVSWPEIAQFKVDAGILTRVHPMHKSRLDRDASRACVLVLLICPASPAAQAVDTLDCG